LHIVEKLYGRGTAQRVAVNLEYRWDPDGRWVRAQLADRPLRRLRGASADWEVLSYDGDTRSWESKYRVHGVEAKAVLASVADALGVEAKDGAFTLKDESGEWKGLATATPDGTGSVLLTVRVDRARA